MKIKLNSKQLWRYLFVAPFFWVLHCFFQPTQFYKEVELKSMTIRLEDVSRILRITLLLFLCTYPLALIGHIFFVYPPVSMLQTNIITFLLHLSPSWPELLSATALGTFLGLVSGMVFGFAGGLAGSIPLGIVGGIAGNIPFGTVSLSGSPQFGTTGVIVILLLAFEGLVLGSIIVRDIRIGLRAGIAVLLALAIAFYVPVRNTSATITLADILVGILLGFTLDGKSGLIVGLVLSTSKLLTGNIEIGVIYGLIFTVSFMLSYFGLLFYPLCTFSTISMYRRSRNNPQQVFDYLQKSALYWYERQWLPLPGLKDTLLIAVNQNVERTLEALTYIIAKRPHQAKAAWSVAVALALRELETFESLAEISKASRYLAQFFPPEGNLLDPQLIKAFTRLSDISRDAASYCNSQNTKIRYLALEVMTNDLQMLSSTVYLKDIPYEGHLKRLTSHWLHLVQQEYEHIKSIAQEIDNPYNAGGVLAKRSSLFVGRQDIIQQLQKALSRGQQRPTFLLYGERRMGKTSLLINLPGLLGALYIPIFYNLQSPGIISNIATLLDSIATEIYEGITDRGIQIIKLEYKQLKEASEENDEAVYGVFDKWLKGLEHLLQQANRTLLLTFDEFERLSEAETTGQLNIKLLLSWFRTIIQDFAHIALLFSGVSTIAELNSTQTNWASYFVNVQNLKVSFLQPTDARLLITQPVHDFPGQDIYGEQVIKKVLQVTGCHPFLLQAICEAMIDILNAEQRHQATINDVEVAVEQIMDSWSNYFHDLWIRTDTDQRECLKALVVLKKADISTIIQKSGMDRKTVQHSLNLLLKRDLIVLQMQCYELSTPIFGKMVERNSIE